MCVQLCPSICVQVCGDKQYPVGMRARSVIIQHAANRPSPSPQSMHQVLVCECVSWLKYVCACVHAPRAISSTFTRCSRFSSFMRSFCASPNTAAAQQEASLTSAQASHHHACRAQVRGRTCARTRRAHAGARQGAEKHAWSCLCQQHSQSNAADAWGCLHLSGCTMRDSFLNCLRTSSIGQSNRRFSFSNGLSLKAHRILHEAQYCCVQQQQQNKKTGNPAQHAPPVDLVVPVHILELRKEDLQKKKKKIKQKEPQ